MVETQVFDLRKAARDEVKRAVAEILPGYMDTISRQAALTALNGCTEIFLNNLPPTIYKTDAVEAVTALPSAQPEIIRCKDCKYNPNPPECGNAACVLFYGMTDQMGFCHHGERRERE